MSKMYLLIKAEREEVISVKVFNTKEEADEEAKERKGFYSVVKFDQFYNVVTIADNTIKEIKRYNNITDSIEEFNRLTTKYIHEKGFYLFENEWKSYFFNMYGEQVTCYICKETKKGKAIKC